MADFCVENFVGEGDSAENLIDGADGVQSLRLDGRKVCNIKRVAYRKQKATKQQFVPCRQSSSL